MPLRAPILVCSIALFAGAPALAQVPAAARPDTVPTLGPARGGSEFWIPFGSVFLPGLGQYLQGAPLTGLGYSATFLAGVAVSTSRDLASVDELPRSAGDQLTYEAFHVAFSAGLLSAWDAFHRPMPRHRQAGKYEFLGPSEDLGDLMTAPLDYRFLGRWTTWVDLAFTGAVMAWAVSEENGADPDQPFHFHDAAFATSLSLNAAVGEEAAFRGWLLPMLTQKTGGRFWLANALQAWMFGSAHSPQAGAFAYVIAAEALYSGWLTRRNDWSVREVVFQHFWYDVAAVTLSLLYDDDGTVTLLPVRLRF